MYHNLFTHSFSESTSWLFPSFWQLWMKLLSTSMCRYFCGHKFSAGDFFKRFYLFLERGEGRKREKNQWVVASHPPTTGTWPTTQACALTGKQTSNLLVHRSTLNPLSYISQGSTGDFLKPQVPGPHLRDSLSVIWGWISSSPQPFWHQGPISWKTIFPQTWVSVGRRQEVELRWYCICLHRWKGGRLGTPGL